MASTVCLLVAEHYGTINSWAFEIVNLLLYFIHIYLSVCLSLHLSVWLYFEKSFWCTCHRLCRTCGVSIFAALHWGPACGWLIDWLIYRCRCCCRNIASMPHTLQLYRTTLSGSHNSSATFGALQSFNWKKRGKPFASRRRVSVLKCVLCSFRQSFRRCRWPSTTQNH